MNRRFLLILAANFLCVFSLFGQSGKREVDTRFGYGIYPLTYDLFDGHFLGCDWDVCYPSVKDDYHNALEFAGDRVSSGCFSFGRYYKVLRWMDLGASYRVFVFVFVFVYVFVIVVALVFVFVFVVVFVLVFVLVLEIGRAHV